MIVEEGPKPMVKRRRINDARSLSLTGMMFLHANLEYVDSGATGSPVVYRRSSRAVGAKIHTVVQALTVEETRMEPLP